MNEYVCVYRGKQSRETEFYTNLSLFISPVLPPAFTPYRYKTRQFAAALNREITTFFFQKQLKERETKLEVKVQRGWCGFGFTLVGENPVQVETVFNGKLSQTRGLAPFPRAYN